MIPIASPALGSEEIRAAVRVLRSGNLTQGKSVQEFEKRFSSFIGTKHGVACSSGTAALQVGLEAVGIKDGDEVITTPFTFIATGNSILYNRAVPVFADIDQRTFNIDPVKIESKITGKTRAVLVVHLYGQPCDMAAMQKICKENDLLLIEDCAQAHGAEYKGKRVGSLGDLSTFSFYATKNMVTGEGGMILTDNEAAAQKAKVIVNQGQLGRYDHVMIGYNYRMMDMQGAIGLVQLGRLAKLNSQRERNARFLSKRLGKLDWVEVPYVSKGVKHVWHQFTVKVQAGIRDDLFEHLNSSGVGARIYYPTPVHLQPAYRSLGYEKGICPVAESLSEQVISLPVHPKLKKAELKRVVEVMEKFR
ncbi:MAG: DegT/DnrJ/EryC1/StrS family aminotransferase [Candidatus Aenigmarchaeota archaeon]|nr:DegT/DnrJ/EryC1/StrS family aminotransferase [Candidatus Aenigmarchaeota archaeon]